MLKSLKTFKSATEFHIKFFAQKEREWRQDELDFYFVSSKYYITTSMYYSFHRGCIFTKFS